ncbi:unnamed protein product [Effrenium voratum]|nr:unnamed protein product [Effrenium voratum]
MVGSGRRLEGYARVAASDGNDKYEAVQELQCQFFRHAFLAWLLLPIAYFAWEFLAPEAAHATCHQGFSNVSLVLLFVVQIHQIYAECRAWNALTSMLAQPEMVVMRHFGVFRSRKFLIVVGLCEAFLLFADVSFPFVARACDHILTDNWQIAWSDVPLVGAFAVRVLTRVRFWGLALLSSLGAIFVNGVLGLLCMPFRSDSNLGGADYVALARAAETAMMPSVALLAEEIANQRRYVVDYKDHDAERARNKAHVLYGRLDSDTATAFEDFNQTLAAHVHLSESIHFLMLLLLKTFVGRCFQLWIQSSFLALAFHQESAGAKDKVIVACVLGALILLHRASHGMRNLGCTGLPVLLLIIAFVIWSGAKVAFAFICEALAFTLWKKSQFKDAILLFHEIEDLIGCSAALCENMGHTYSSMGNYDEASNYFNKALLCLDEEEKIGKKTGDRAGILLGLGLIEDRLGRFEKALAAVRESQALFRQRANGKPSSLVAKAGMSIAKILLKLALQEPDSKKREEMEEEAVEREQENVALFEVTCGDDSPLTASALRGLGEALKRRGKIGEAIESFARSYNLEAQKDAFDLLAVMEVHNHLFGAHMDLVKSGSPLSRASFRAYLPTVDITLRRVRNMPQDANAGAYYKARLNSWSRGGHSIQ